MPAGVVSTARRDTRFSLDDGARRLLLNASLPHPADPESHFHVQFARHRLPIARSRNELVAAGGICRFGDAASC